MHLRAVLPVDILKKFALATASLVLLLALASCQQDAEEGTDEFGQTDTTAVVGGTTGGQAETYRADLSEINSDITEETVSGTASVQVTQDSITFIVDASGLPPGTMHMVHFHGFADGRQASCPTMDADQNQDDIVDVTEVEMAAGIPLIPLNANPTEMNQDDQSYPVADQQGNLRYRQTIAREDLQNMLQDHGIDNPNFEAYVVNVHGIQDTMLPQSVQSMDGMPAYMSVPVACGALERAQGSTRTQPPNGDQTRQGTTETGDR